MRNGNDAIQTVNGYFTRIHNYELVRPTEEDLGGQVPSRFAAEGALNGDGFEREFPAAGWNVAAASLACDDEALPISGHLEHARMIGKCITRI